MEVAALLAVGLGDWIDFGVICGILLLNAFVAFYQEKSAADIVASLKGNIAMRCTVVRDGQEQNILAREIVPGDIVRRQPTNPPRVNDFGNSKLTVLFHSSLSKKVTPSPPTFSSSATTPALRTSRSSSSSVPRASWAAATTSPRRRMRRTRRAPWPTTAPLPSSPSTSPPSLVNPWPSTSTSETLPTTPPAASAERPTPSSLLLPRTLSSARRLISSRAPRTRVTSRLS